MTLLRSKPRRLGRSLAPSDLPPPILGSASRGFGFPLTRGNSKGAPIWSGQMKMRAIGGRLQAKGVLRGQLRLSQLGRLGSPLRKASET